MRTYTRFIVIASFSCALLGPHIALAQRFTTNGPSSLAPATGTKSDVEGQLAFEALRSGKIDEARRYLNGADPESPYAMFVRAALTKDGVTAANMYKMIVAENEGTPIAREALIQLYRYHYATGQYQAAHRDYVELEKFALPPPVSDPVGLADSLQSIPQFQPKESVQPAAVPPETPAPVSVAAPVKPTIYLVQVGVFTTRDNAWKFVQDLKVYGVTGKVFPKDIGGRTFYGVSAGTFSDQGAAQDRANNLKSRSINAIVVEQ
jgi:hypothetical protein